MGSLFYHLKLLITLVLTVMYFSYFYNLIKIDLQDSLTIPKKNIVPSHVEYNFGLNRNGRKQSSYPIRLKVRKHNNEQKIYNNLEFGPLKNESIVLLIQVHNRIAYLRHLIQSLSEVEGIANHLVIFSHDYYDKMLNTLVRNVHFCKTMQIFYPYSVQMHQLKFPGDDTKDCPRNNASLTTRKYHSRCRKSYDSYGNIRQAKLCQIKHHFWWNWCRIFDELEITRDFNGLVVYLEEDYYVLKDFTRMIELMKRRSKDMFPTVNVNIISLQSKNTDFEERSFKQVSIADWSQGIAINRSTWNYIRYCSKYFCKYDDYNWDWSFSYLTKKCPMKTMIANLPRIYNIGECGIHGTSNNCTPWIAVDNLKQMIAKNPRIKLFPHSLEVVRSAPPETHNRFPFGSWGDVRDVNLCMEMAWKHIL